MSWKFDLSMTKEEAINKAIEIEFGLGNDRSIREHNSSLVKIAEHVYDLLHPSLPSNLDEAAEEYVKTTSVKVWGRIDPKKDLGGYMARANYGTGLLDGFKAGAEWMARQGEIVLGNITRVGDRLDVETLEYLPEESEFEIGDKVIVQIRKKD